MNENPLVSIIVPVYNMSRFLPRAIDSFLSQTLKDFEILIYDNNSSDNVDEILQGYNDNRIKYIRNDSNIGMIANFNKGLISARGKYITLISCDEFMLQNESLEKRVALLENGSGIDFVWCGYDLELLPEHGSRRVAFPIKWPEKDVMTAGDAIDALYRDRLATLFRITTVVVRADILRSMRYTIPLVHSGDMIISLDWLIHSRMAACVKETLHRSYMHLEHQHDFFGQRFPYVGERDYLIIKFLDERKTRLLAMGLPIATYEGLILWRMIKLLPRMACNDYSYFVHYSWFIVGRVMNLVCRAVHGMIVLPFYVSLRWLLHGYYIIRAKLARVAFIRRIYLKFRKDAKGR